MAGSKRRALTADDLMRMQEEGPLRKRLRLEDSDDELGAEDETSGSEDAQRDRKEGSDAHTYSRCRELFYLAHVLFRHRCELISVLGRRVEVATGGRERCC